MNGFGAHRIEGIGDKHVPWIHNVRNTDLVTAIDDDDCMRLLRLFNEPCGLRQLRARGVASELADALELFGISGIANILAAIKTAKYFECGGDDVIVTIATDSAELYRSRLAELAEQHGPYTEIQAAGDLERCLYGAGVDHLKELTYPDRKAIHNLKYFTWVEQQRKDPDDLDRLWYDRTLWQRLLTQPIAWDRLIRDFNDRTGLTP